jgi:hypothetical protein
MSLFDVDKSGEQRNNPQPNSSDGVGQRMAHQTNSTTYVPISGAPQAQRLVFKNNMFVTYDAANLVSSVYGYVTGVGTTPVLIIAQAGKDVFADVLGISRPAGI